MVSMIEKYNLLHQILENAVWKGKDAFPSDEIWANEVEKWLSFIDSKGQFNRFIPRLTKQDTKKRDEALAEISSAYFLEKRSGFSIIEWEPIGTDNTIGEFVLCIDSTSVFCEVKSPGWESEVINQHGIETTRLNLPKYINGEVKGVDNSVAIRNAIDRAYKKLPVDKPTLLIFNDDLWFSVLNEITISEPDELPLSMYRALYYEPLPFPYSDNKPQGCFKTKLYERLSGVLFLNIINNGSIIYKSKLVENENAINKLPNGLIKGVNQLQTENDSNARYFKAIKRNLFEVAHALLERKALISIENYNNKQGIYGENFFSISYRALFNDMIAHSIKVLDEDSESATFWYILRIDIAKIKKMVCYSEAKTEFLKELAYKLKIIRDKTHFHIDKKGLIDPDDVWDKAGIKGRELGESLEYLWIVLNKLHQAVLKEDFPHQIDFYDGKDVFELLGLSRKNNLI